MAIDWAKIDWTKATAELAKELGVSKRAVKAARAKLAPETRGASGAERYREIDWAEVRLGGAPDVDIARELGVSAYRVFNARRKRGIAPYAKVERRRARAKLASEGELRGIDAGTLAEQLRKAAEVAAGDARAAWENNKVTEADDCERRARRLVAAAEALSGGGAIDAEVIGEALNPIKRRGGVRPLAPARDKASWRRREPIDWEKIDWTKATAEIAREQGVSDRAVRAARAKYAPETKGGRALSTAEVRWLSVKLERWENMARLLADAARKASNGLKREEYEKALADVEGDIAMAKGILEAGGAEALELTEAA